MCSSDLFRFLVGKPGLDGHSNGAEQIAVRARDAGFEVIYQGIRLTPEQIVAAAVAEDVDVVGLSILSGSHRSLVPAIMNGLAAEGADDVVVVGSQRPASAFSTDAGMNLLNAIRVAGSAEARDLGVLALLNDEIQAAREVTKTSTYRLQTFRSPDFGVLGHADGDGTVAIYRRPVRRHAPNTEFDVAELEDLPRVDILYSYAGSDGAAVDAFVQAGAKGIVAAGMAPGFCTVAECAALEKAQAAGVIVAQGSRAGSGRVMPGETMRLKGAVSADNLNPQKARILLMIALTKTDDLEELHRIFTTY